MPLSIAIREEKEETVKILIDVGGSSVKIKGYSKGRLQPETQRFKPTTFDEFCDAISQVAKERESSTDSVIEGIAISFAGEYDYVNECAVSCWHYPFLTGCLRDNLVRRFNCRNVHVVNDGDAHALALKADYAQKGMALRGAINLSLGTAVGFGVLDWKGDLIHTCRGHNWEVGNWQCDTREEHKDQYWALGSQGLKSLEDKHGNPDAYIYYGQRLCHFFARDLVPVFHPPVIGLSGGIVAGHIQEIEEGIRRECESRHYCEDGGVLRDVEIHLSPDKDFVMLGLAKLVERSLISGLADSIFMRFSKLKREPVVSAHVWSREDDEEWERMFPTFRQEFFSENEHWANNATTEELASTLRNEFHGRSDGKIEDLVKEYNEVETRIPHAWRSLCFRFGEELARRLILEDSLCDCSDWMRAIPENRSSAIVGIHSGKVVCAEDAGAAPLAANRRICLGCWELFTLVKNDDGSFSLKSAANDKFVSANQNKEGCLIAEGLRVDLWEKFDIKEVAGKPGVFTLWSYVTKKFVSVDETQGNVLIANRDVASDWEEFRIFSR